ncbi:MAG: acyclic terpene utilization AtuA family protein [Albidovulum sp.]|nr:acyclic terpene utilization AtuA family protein [Albidovulum sp.]
MKNVKILCPTGHLSFTPLEPESFLRGCEQGPDFVIADAGSCDIGPRPLGADQHVSHAAWQRHDLGIMLCQSRRLNIPMIVGSASDTGTNRGVNQFVDIIREVAEERELAPFKLAAIYSEVPVEVLRERLSEGVRIEGLGGRPDADEDNLDSTDRAVAVMNAEPIRAALADGADVVIAGRASDCALFAAPLLNAGHGPGVSYFAGKLMECASFCAEPYMAKESILGEIENDSVYLTAMHPNQRCTPESVAGHSIYERENPFREHIAGGYVDMSNCVYTRADKQTTKATGAVFVEAPVCKVKLEGAGKVGERRLAIVGVRDPETSARIDQAVDWSRGKLSTRFGPPGDSYEIYFHTFGRNGVMRDLEPFAPRVPHELCVVIEVISKDERMAEEIAALASRNLFYARLPGLKGTAGAAALMSDEVLVGEAGYRWTLNHVMEVRHATELFSTSSMTIGKN